MLKRVVVLMILFAVAGCSDPKPQVIDMDEVAAEAGLSKDDYTVHENGAMEIHSKVDTDNSNSRPLATHGDNWHHVITNGLLVADDYATKNNPSAVFSIKSPSVNLIKQYGGKYEGKYLLTVVNDNDGDTSYAQLLPLFDINESSDNLEDKLNNDTPLWKVTLAKYNGREF